MLSHPTAAPTSDFPRRISWYMISAALMEETHCWFIVQATVSHEQPALMAT